MYQKTKWSYNISKYSITKPSKEYQIWKFWFEDIASGNPDPRMSLG
jgi:hypothetical protein